MIVQVVDTRTSRILFSTTVEGKANDFDIGGALAGFGGGVGGLAGLGTWQKTPVGKAIRIAVQQAVRELSARTPQTYFRHGAEGNSATPAVSKSQPQSSLPTVQPVRHGLGKASLTVTMTSILPSGIIVKSAAANLHDAPAIQSKAVATLKQGTKLFVQGEEKDWYFVQAEDGKGGWISKSVTAQESAGAGHDY